MEKQKFSKEYIAPVSISLMLQMDGAILSGSFTHEDIGNETDISGKFGFISNF